MGAENSKSNPKTIQDNSKALLNRLIQNEREIDKHVVYQIRRALIQYSKQIKGNKNIKSVIDHALLTLDSAPTKSENIQISGKLNLQNLPAYVKEIGEKLKDEDTPLKQFEIYLETLTKYSQELEKSKLMKREKIREAQKTLPVLFLELFVKTPPKIKTHVTKGKATDAKSRNKPTKTIFYENKAAEKPKAEATGVKMKLQQNLDYLNGVRNNLRILNEQNFTFDAEIEQRLQEAECLIGDIKGIIVDQRRRRGAERADVENRKVENGRPHKQNHKDDHQNLSREHLRKLKTTLEKYRAHVKTFDYSIRSNIYQQYRREILSLREELRNAVPEQDRETLSQEINSLVNILDRNATRCFLNKLDDEIIATIKSQTSGQLKAKKFDEIRRKAYSIMSEDDAIKSRKAEVLANVPKVDKVYDLKQSLRSNSFKITISLDKYRKEIKNFSYPISSETYRKTRQEISSLLNDLQETPENLKPKLVDDVQQMLKNLEKVAQEIEDKNNILDVLSEIDDKINAIDSANLAPVKKRGVFKEYIREIDAIRGVDEEVQIEKNNLLKKIQLVQDKEQPKMKQQEAKKILDLQQYFNDFNLNDIKVPRESIEFIKIIRERAETFSDKVRNYRGNNYSVGYYVLEENLMRLLEILDKIKCQQDEEMLREKITTVTYIKKLQFQLDTNADQD